MTHAAAKGLNGFILQPTYRIEGGKPVVHLWGKIESGQTFLIRDHRSTPHFYVRARDATTARDQGARPLTPARFSSSAAPSSKWRATASTM